MRLAEPFQMRLTEEQRRQYQEEADAAGERFTTYVRKKLEKSDRVAEELARLSAHFEASRSEPTTVAAPRGTSEESILVEALLLLRIAVGDKNMAMVHAEITRQGLKVWTGK